MPPTRPAAQIMYCTPLEEASSGLEDAKKRPPMMSSGITDPFDALSSLEGVEASRFERGRKEMSRGATL